MYKHSNKLEADTHKSANTHAEENRPCLVMLTFDLSTSK